MTDYEVPKEQAVGKAVAEQQLHQELEAAGIPLTGISTARSPEGTLARVIVHLKGAADAGVKKKVGEVLKKHAAKPTPAPKGATGER